MSKLDATVPAEIVMIIGFVMCAMGFTTKMFWWTFGGFLLFYMGVMALEPLTDKSDEPVR